METTTRTHSAKTTYVVNPKPADGRGSIDGFSAVCGTCGYEMGHAFEQSARRDIIEHINYMIGRGR